MNYKNISKELKVSCIGNLSIQVCKYPIYQHRKMEDNSNECETIVNERQVISNFGHKVYILAYSGPCQRSQPVNSSIFDVWQSPEFVCAHDYLDIIFDAISLPVQPNLIDKLKWGCSCILNVFNFW